VRTAALLHELGHAVGLNHAHFTSEVMYPSVSDAGPNYYSAGDLAGLAKVGRPAGCLS
jgi:predicted Zn-dependent protease